MVRVVIPCYNEAHRLHEEPFLDFLSRNDDVRILFVDDGSRDETTNRLRSICAAMPERMDCMTLLQNVGKGEAVRAGILKVIPDDPEFFAYWDADLSPPLSELELLRDELNARQERLIAMGARLCILGHRIVRSSFRHYIGRVIATLISLSLRVAVYDTQCGAKVFRNTSATRCLFDAPFRSRWLFDVEILQRLQRTCPIEEAVVEVPLREWVDVKGSKVLVRHAPAILFDLFRIWRHGKPIMVL